MKKTQKRVLPFGYTEMCCRTGDEKVFLMDFGILKLRATESYEANSRDEWALLLICGEVEVTIDGVAFHGKRGSCLEDKPWCINFSGERHIWIYGISEECEIAVMKTENSKCFGPFERSGERITSEWRGAGLMQEAATRLIRMVNDVKLAPESNLVIGEDVQLPGKWAGFSPHHHPQPEVYYYKFFPEHGFALMRHGEEGVLVENNDIVMVEPGCVHPQVTAPGYAMYYLWVIRHLDGNPDIEPEYAPQHMWTAQEDAPIWDGKIND